MGGHKQEREERDDRESTAPKRSPAPPYRPSCGSIRKLCVKEHNLEEVGVRDVTPEFAPGIWRVQSHVLMGPKRYYVSNRTNSYFAACFFSSGTRVMFIGLSYLLSDPVAESTAHPMPPPATILPHVAPAVPE
jgi:hypothetical protein